MLFRCYLYNRNVYFGWKLSSRVLCVGSNILKKGSPGFLLLVVIPFVKLVFKAKSSPMQRAAIMWPVPRITFAAKWTATTSNSFLLTDLFWGLPNPPKLKLPIKTPHFKPPKPPKKRNFNKILKHIQPPRAITLLKDTFWMRLTQTQRINLIFWRIKYVPSPSKAFGDCLCLWPSKNLFQMRYFRWT